MAQPAATDGARRAAVAGAVAALLGGVGLAIVLAGAAGPAPSVWARVIGLGAAVLLVGLGSLDALGVEPSARVIGAAATVWLLAIVVGVWWWAAERAGVSPPQVSVADFLDAWSGRPAELVAAAGALAAAGWAAGRVTGRFGAPSALVAGAAGVGVVAQAVAGHASMTALGPVLVGAHALAAAWWCGALAALALTVRGRSGWAAALPRFSALALWAVVVLATTGVVVAVGALDVVGGQGVSVLWSSGYGRVVVAKAVLLVALVALALRHRRRWLPRAAAHRAAERDSLRYAATEVVVMAIALGLAAGLAGAAPPG